SISTRPKRQLLAGACPGTAAQSEADNGQRLIEPERATAIGRDHRRQALAEDAAVTILIRAEELARLQPQADGNACRGQIGQLSFIATVKPGRDNLASGAMTLSLGSLHHDSNQVCLRDNLFQFECDRISKERLHPLLYTSRSLGSPKARENQIIGFILTFDTGGEMRWLIRSIFSSNDITWSEANSARRIKLCHCNHKLSIACPLKRPALQNQSSRMGTSISLWLIHWGPFWPIRTSPIFIPKEGNQQSLRSGWRWPPSCNTWKG